MLDIFIYDSIRINLIRINNGPTSRWEQSAGLRKSRDPRTTQQCLYNYFKREEMNSCKTPTPYREFNSRLFKHCFLRLHVVQFSTLLIALFENNGDVFSIYPSLGSIFQITVLEMLKFVEKLIERRYFYEEYLHNNNVNCSKWIQHLICKTHWVYLARQINCQTFKLL